MDSPKGILGTLIYSNLVSQLYSMFSPSPAKPIFSDLLLSMYLESKLIKEAEELYSLIRKDRKFSSLSAFKVFLETLNNLRHYKQTLEVFPDVMNCGIRVDR